MKSSLVALALVAGLVVGAALSFYAARAATSFLYELKPSDPLTMVMAMATLASVTLLAGWIPARRAARLPPTVALREE